MIRIPWDLTEAVVLVALYIDNGESISVSTDDFIRLSDMLKKRATSNGIIYDSKFRNVSGLKRQIGCVQYVATNGAKGYSNAARIFYKAYELFTNHPGSFLRIKEEFYSEYSEK